MLRFWEKIKPGFEIAEISGEKKTLRAKRAKILGDILGVLQGKTLRKGSKRGPKSATKLVRFSGKNREIAEILEKNKTPF